MRLLVIEDEYDLARSVADGLRIDGYEVDLCDNGTTGLEMCLTEPYDLILLDLNLPEMDGMQVLHEFRKTNETTPVLILSARMQVSDKIAGLDEGANDYLTKPFHFDELEARIRSLTRRKFVQENNVLKIGALSFDCRKRSACVDNEEIHLTRKEAGILEYLMMHRGIFVSQETLMEHVWDNSVDEFSNSIRVHMSSLRKKLRAALGEDPITNQIGRGYQIGGQM